LATISVNLALSLVAILALKLLMPVINVKENRFYTTTNALINVLLAPTSFPQVPVTLAEPIVLTVRTNTPARDASPEKSFKELTVFLSAMMETLQLMGNAQNAKTRTAEDAYQLT
jgi:hypothetical protein